MSAKSSAKPIIRRRRVESVHPSLPTLLSVPDFRGTGVVSNDEPAPAAGTDTPPPVLPPQLDVVECEVPEFEVPEFEVPELAASDDADTHLAADSAATTLVDSPTVEETLVDSKHEAVVETKTTYDLQWFSNNMKRNLGTLGIISVAIVACTLVARAMKYDHNYRGIDLSSTPSAELVDKTGGEESSSEVIAAVTPDFDPAMLGTSAQDAGQGSLNKSVQRLPEQAETVNRVASVPQLNTRIENGSNADIDPFADRSFGEQPGQPLNTNMVQQYQAGQIQSGQFQAQQPFGNPPQQPGVFRRADAGSTLPLQQPNGQAGYAPNQNSFNAQSQQSQSAHGISSGTPGAYGTTPNNGGVPQNGSLNFEGRPPLPANINTNTQAAYPSTPSHYQPLEGLRAEFARQRAELQQLQVGDRRNSQSYPAAVQQGGGNFTNQPPFNNGGVIR